MRMLRIVFFIVGAYGQSDVYWGSYELNIPGGSGSGNAVQDLKLPENAPEFFQFANFKSQPFAAPQFTPVAQPAPQPAPRPAQQAVLRQALQPAPLTARQQGRPAPQPQQLRVFQPQPDNRQQQRQGPAHIRQQAEIRQPSQIRQPAQIIQPAQIRQPSQIRQPAQNRQPAQIRQQAPQPSPVKKQAVQVLQPTQRFQNFAARTEERRPSPAVQAQPSVDENEVDTENSKNEAVVDISDLTRFQLYQLRQKLKLQKERQMVENNELAKSTTLKSADLQETTAPTFKVVPERTRTGIRRKAVRRKHIRNNA